MKLTGILVDVENETAEVTTIERNLHEYYRILHCDCIDITMRKIGKFGKRFYNIICDDEGLLKDNPKISAINDLGQVMLCGSLFIVNDDENGELSSLTKDDQIWIMRFIQKQGTRKYPKPYPILHQVDYCY
jgi:hypothetical protein